MRIWCFMRNLTDKNYYLLLVFSAAILHGYLLLRTILRIQLLIVLDDVLYVECIFISGVAAHPFTSFWRVVLDISESNWLSDISSCPLFYWRHGAEAHYLSRFLHRIPTTSRRLLEILDSDPITRSKSCTGQLCPASQYQHLFRETQPMFQTK